MRGTQQIWNLVWQEGSYDNHTAPGPTHTPRGVRNDPKLGAASLMAPKASREDSRAQAILKFYRSISLDYRATTDSK